MVPVEEAVGTAAGRFPGPRPYYHSDTAGCPARGLHGDLPHRRLPRPALRHMSPCSLPPPPQAGGHGCWKAWSCLGDRGRRLPESQAGRGPPPSLEAPRGQEGRSRRPPEGCSPVARRQDCLPDPPPVLCPWRRPVLESVAASTGCSVPRGPQEGQPVDGKDKTAAMPDSPAEVKSQPRSTPPSMPPPPPAASQGATRLPSFTPHTIMNGTHSPTAVNGAPSTPSGFSNGPATSSTASLSTQHLPPACGARQLSKLKRFLTTLQQFGSDISPEIGERVRTLVLGLVNSTLTIEEFHSKLQEATNFPLRPFVIPFLKANLPLLQRELLHCARLAKQTPAQYLAQHEQLLLDANASSPIDSSELLLEVNENGKRRTPDRTKENGSDRDPLHPDHVSKRPCTLSPAQRYSPSHGPPQPTPPPHYRLEDMAMAHHFRDPYRHHEPRELRERHRQLAVHGSRQEEVIDHRLTDREWAEEWKHLNNLLNCIMDMAEKTRRSLTVLRQCQEADREEINHWIRRYSDTEDAKKGPVPATARPLNSSVGAEGSQLDAHREFMPRTLSGYMPEEIWRKAEEAVNEVKRQAMSELQKAVSDAERKAHELISTERAKMERALAEARRQASEDALTVINQQEDSSESCWNCGRKASETCSGCNAARYCGSFCQHKDWEKHHHVCGQSLQGPVAAVADPGPGQPDATAGLGPCLPTGAASPSEASSAGPSRPGSPGPPGPLDAAPR
ncbi:protein CBFA2T3 isoform X2 [Leopardus geoffroyi]|uniref:protein CBFA2T3 isoform X2 n=1 Tax=Leopardus geoffroyi TaxID=46844 RepID=UPI001E260ED7|nr:protein CBFA2T3 isoform X2 [Leopardus geoffroyi]